MRLNVEKISTADVLQSNSLLVKNSSYTEQKYLQRSIVQTSN